MLIMSPINNNIFIEKFLSSIYFSYLARGMILIYFRRLTNDAKYCRSNNFIRASLQKILLLFFSYEWPFFMAEMKFINNFQVKTE